MQTNQPISRRRFVGTTALDEASLPLAGFAPWKHQPVTTPADKLLVFRPDERRDRRRKIEGLRPLVSI